MAENPKVFISYSYDSQEHRRWILKLSTLLHQNDVGVMLDQWDLSPGQDWRQFIEHSVRNSDRILLICTNNYISKLYSGIGGVGYEWQIANALYAQELGTNHFIPIIRHTSGRQKLPAFLEGLVCFDFTDESQFNARFNDLLHEIQRGPVRKSSLGKFSLAQLPEIPQLVGSASDVYSAAFRVARAGDLLGWRQLLKGIKPQVFNSLVQWRQNELDGQQPNSKEQLVQVVDKAVEFISPLVIVALVGVESGREQFRDQRSLLDDLRHIAGWNPAGYTVWVNIPNALGYIYHSLHGSLCLSTNQLELALGLARVKIPVANGTKYLQVWKMGELRGYAESISGTRGGNCMESWQYLTNAYGKWTWLSHVFGEMSEYRTSLVAYYMALNIHELATVIASGRQNTLSATSDPYFHIPLTFLFEDYDTIQRATSLLRSNPEGLMALWSCVNVTREQMENSWANWVRLSENEIIRYGVPSFPQALVNLTDIYQHLFEAL